MSPNDRRPLSTYMITRAAASADTVVESALRALGVGVDHVQLRMPEHSGRQVERTLQEILTRRPDAASRLLVNDRFDLAVATDVSGVHLPGRGLPVGRVRASAPPGFRIAVSTHRVSEVKAAEKGGADFVVFGPVYPTASKPGHPGLGLGALRDAVRSSRVPVFALGGITLATLDDVVASGVYGVAGISIFEDTDAVRSLVASSS